MISQGDTKLPLGMAQRVLSCLKNQEEAGISSNTVARYLRRIALEFAKKGDFQNSFAVCNDISSKYWGIRAMMDISYEMLVAGQEVEALKKLELAWEHNREQIEGFPEADLFDYLDTISSYGHGRLVHSMLKFALARAEQLEDGEFRLHCYNRMIPYLAVHWKIKAEEIIDYILCLPSGRPGTQDEKQCPSLEILIDIALEISRYDLTWDVARQERFADKLSGIAS